MSVIHRQPYLRKWECFMQGILEFGDSDLNLVIKLVMKEKPRVLTTFL